MFKSRIYQIEISYKNRAAKLMSKTGTRSYFNVSEISLNRLYKFMTINTNYVACGGVRVIVII